MRVLFRRISVRFSVPGFHCWPQAPKRRKYLRKVHRHLFGVTVMMVVGHNEREVEFHDLLDDARAMFHVKQEWSCETAAEQLGGKLSEKYKRAVLVRVSEDNECDAEILVDFEQSDPDKKTAPRGRRQVRG